MQKFLAIFSLVFICLGAVAQDDPYTYTYETPDLAHQTKNDIIIVAAAGLAGAVLGLSTLSFVSEPDDHYDNILTGGALGIIAGVIYVAYRQASQPPPFQDQPHRTREIEDRTYTFHYKSIPEAQIDKAAILKPAALGFSTSF